MTLDGGQSISFTYPVWSYEGRHIEFEPALVTYKDAEPFTTQVKHMDYAKSRRDLKHDPKVPPEEGIPRTIEWMKTVYGIK